MAQQEANVVSTVIH